VIAHGDRRSFLGRYRHDGEEERRIGIAESSIFHTHIYILSAPVSAALSVNVYQEISSAFEGERHASLSARSFSMECATKGQSAAQHICTSTNSVHALKFYALCLVDSNMI